MKEVTSSYADSGRQQTADRQATGELSLEHERSLASRILEGDDAAFNELYQRYVPRLFQFIYYALSGDREQTEDVLQETMLAAVRSLRRYRGDSSLYTWLYAIARNKIGDHIRRQKRRGPQPVELPVDLRERSPGVESRVIDRYQVQQALDALPADYRVALLGKYYEGFSVAELAQVMGRSEKAVESLLTRARNAFRSQIESSGSIMR